MPLTWLHLTDLHVGQSDQDHLFPAIKERFWEDVQKYSDEQRAGEIDLILFSGDLVQRGSREEFERFEELLLDVRQQLAPGAVFLAVPGNHDLTRPKAADAAVAGLMHLWTGKTTAEGSVQDLFWADATSSQRRVVDTAFANYVEWWKGSALNPFNAAPGVEMRAAVSHHATGLLPGDFRITVTKDGIRLGVLGLNSTFLQLTGGNLKSTLSVGLPQVTRLCPDLSRWVKGHHLAFLLTHQPPDWLTDRSRQDLLNDINPPGRFALHLMGHMHESVASSQSYGNSDQRRSFQGRSWFGLEYVGDRDESTRQSRSHGYALGRIEWHESQLKLRIWPRAVDKVPPAGYTVGADRFAGTLLDESYVQFHVAPKLEADVRRLTRADADYFSRQVYPIIASRLPSADVRPLDYLLSKLQGDAVPARHFFVVESRNSPVGVLYCRDDEAGDCVFVSYLVVRKAESATKADKASELLLAELRQMVMKSKRKYVLMELAHPAHTTDHGVYIESISRMKLFSQFAGNFGFQLAALDATYLQPALTAGERPIPHLLVVGRRYTAGLTPAAIPREEGSAILKAVYGGYSAGAEPSFVESCQQLEAEAIAALSDPVTLVGCGDIQKRWPLARTS